MASMMDEMAKTLARRRAAAEKKQPEQPPVRKSSTRFRHFVVYFGYEQMEIIYSSPEEKLIKRMIDDSL
jgi:hypothetical protein